MVPFCNGILSKELANTQRIMCRELSWWRIHLSGRSKLSERLNNTFDGSLSFSNELKVNDPRDIQAWFCVIVCIFSLSLLKLVIQNRTNVLLALSTIFTQNLPLISPPEQRVTRDILLPLLLGNEQRVWFAFSLSCKNKLKFVQTCLGRKMFVWIIAPAIRCVISWTKLSPVKSG